MEMGKLLGTYVTQAVLTNAHLGFYEGQETLILGNIFDKVQNWRITIPQLGGIRKIKKHNC